VSTRRWIFADLEPIVDQERRGTDPP